MRLAAGDGTVEISIGDFPNYAQLSIDESSSGCFRILLTLGNKDTDQVEVHFDGKKMTATARKGPGEAREL